MAHIVSYQAPRVVDWVLILIDQSLHRIEKVDITLTSCCIKLSGEGAEKPSQEIELKIWFNSLVYQSTSEEIGSEVGL